MNRLRAVLATLMLSAPLAARAAEVTRIASSFEDEDPFGMFIDTGAQFTFHRATLLREQLPQDGDTLARPALDYTRTDLRLNVDVAVGLYRDLELRVGLPIVLLQSESWAFAENASSAIKAGIDQNCVAATGEPLGDCGVSGGQPLFGLAPWRTYRGGLGNARFSLVYGLFQQHRDETKPNWLVGVDYEAPTAPRLDPRQVTTLGDRGQVGDRVHKYTFHTALSRRFGVAEPYFKVSYTLPVRGPGAYDNCEGLEQGLLGFPGNCRNTEWPRQETTIRAPSVLGTLMGTELTLLENPADHSRLVVDLRAQATWVSEGRYYNALSGLMQKLLYSGDYLQFGGQLGVTLQSWEFMRLRFSAAYLYTTEHALTAEPTGKDVDNDGQPDVDGAGANPSYDFRVDFVSRRFFAATGRDFRLDATAVFAF